MTDEKSAGRLQTLLTSTLVILLLASGLGRAQGVVLPLPAADQQKITAHLGPGVVGAALPSQPIQEESTNIPLQAKAMTYEVKSGPNNGNMQTLGLAQAKRPQWSVGLAVPAFADAGRLHPSDRGRRSYDAGRS
jgi:hypothetical protein